MKNSPRRSGAKPTAAMLRSLAPFFGFAEADQEADQYAAGSADAAICAWRTASANAIWRHASWLMDIALDAGP
jgi:hypothetical protein